MPDFDPKNRGAIWKNDDKQNAGHPDFKGSLNVDGREFWVSAWKRKEGASAASPALSFSVRPKDAPRAEPQPQSISERAKATVRSPQRDDSEVPF